MLIDIQPQFIDETTLMMKFIFKDTIPNYVAEKLIKRIVDTPVYQKLGEKYDIITFSCVRNINDVEIINIDDEMINNYINDYVNTVDSSTEQTALDKAMKCIKELS